jgi:class 3 adenylate cyclase
MERKMAQRTAPRFAENEAHDPADSNWLTAQEVMDATGISKDDLLRFIQLNVLPKSMMRVSPAGHDATRKKSYFSATILGHVAMLKLLRDEGHTVETIAKELRQTEEHPGYSSQQPSPKTQPAASLNGEKAGDAVPLYFPFPASAIKGSAFFVNQGLHIGWVKVVQDDGLFGAIRDEMNDDPSGTVFDILLRASLKELVFNWQPLFSFIYQFLEETTPPETFKRLAPMVSLHLEELNQPVNSMGRPQKGQPRIDSCPIRIENEKGRMQAMRLYAMALSEGALFIFEEERWQDHDGDAKNGGTFGEGRSAVESTDTKTPFSVISVRLDNSQRLVDTLLPETYFQLITRIWDESDRIIQSYGGQRAKRSGTEVQYIIPRHAGTDPAYDAIRCAIELREKVREIEASRKADGGWFATIRLNMGISSGKDHLPAEDLTASVAFMLPGGAADQAFHLSAIAHGGTILITKSAFGHLSRRQMKGITFGIYRDDRLIPRIFAQVSELPHGTDTPPLAREIRSLFVTRIIDLQPKKRRGNR